MKTINFKKTIERLTVTRPSENNRDDLAQKETERRVARNQREDLIEQIVAQCVHKKKGDDRKLAKLLSVTANTARWTATDLHALLQKRNDPNLRNYTAFVWWSAKMKKTVVSK